MHNAVPDIDINKIYSLDIQGNFRDFSPGTVGDLVSAFASRGPWSLIVRRYCDNQWAQQFTLQVIHSITDVGQPPHLEPLREEELRRLAEFCRGFLAAREVSS